MLKVHSIALNIFPSEKNMVENRKIDIEQEYPGFHLLSSAALMGVIYATNKYRTGLPQALGLCGLDCLCTSRVRWRWHSLKLIDRAAIHILIIYKWYMRKNLKLFLLLLLWAAHYLSALPSNNDEARDDTLHCEHQFYVPRFWSDLQIRHALKRFIPASYI